jgi:glycosyltransferase involved in cell wall biosynthesis
VPHLRLARSLIAAGRLKDAEYICVTVLNGEENAVAHHLLGYIAQQTGRYILAIKSCTRANTLGLSDWSNHLILGLSHRSLKEQEQARTAFNIAHQMSPLNVDAAVFLLQATYETNGFEAARAVRESFANPLNVDRVVSAWRDIAEKHRMTLIRSLMRDGQLEEAEEICKLELREKPSRRIGRMLEHIGHYRKWHQYRADRSKANSDLYAPTISVLVITYNHEKYVKQAIESILQQETKYNVEIVVMEDCSTDATRDIIMQISAQNPGKIKAFFNPTNVGMLDPPQQKVTYEGFKKLGGEYIAILEGDDYWSSKHKVQTQIDFLEENPEFVACAHNTVKIYDDCSKEAHRFLYWEDTKSDHDVEDMITYSFFHTSSIVYRNILRSNPPTFFRSRWFCDISLNIYFAHHGLIKYMNKDMSVYRAHFGGLYSTWSPIKGDLYNINGYIRYNHWMRYRYTRSFAYQIARRIKLMLEDENKAVLLPLRSKLKYKVINIICYRIAKLLERHPSLDPAVFWHGDQRSNFPARSE